MGRRELGRLDAAVDAAGLERPGAKDVIRESIGGTVWLVGVGLMIGAAAATALANVLGAQISGLLFGLTPTDWTSVLAAGLLMMIVAVIACVVPAVRATRIDPLKAIRSE